MADFKKIRFINKDSTTTEVMCKDEQARNDLLLKANITDLVPIKNSIKDLEAQTTFKRYGVSGIGLQSSTLTRIYDSIGMTATVGVDDEDVTNDFDNAAPFMRRKCVGTWLLEDQRAIFNINAYYGDDNYTEDGSMGDYVAVECPLCYYYMNNGQLIISAHKYPDYHPFDIFCRNHDENDLLPYVYLPAYPLALKDGKAVSLPGLENENGAYKTLVDYARTYDNGSLGNKAMLLPAAVNFYEYALFTVEFATQNCQSIMAGVSNYRSNGDDRVTFVDATHVLTSNYQAGRKVGYRISIMPTSVSDVHDGRYKATHVITSVTRCDENGNPSDSGTHQLLELEDLERNYWTYDTTGSTQYKIGGRPFLTGTTKNIKASSGSVSNNTDGYNSMRYRWRENIYGNQYWTSMDLFGIRQGTGDDDYYIEWYYLKNPEEYTPSSTSNPNINDLNTSLFKKLDITTLHDNYVNGYIKSKKYSKDYPDIWIPYETTGGSSSTYYCDNASLVNSAVVRSVRFGGAWSHGAFDGLSFFSGHNAPSFASALYGGALYFVQ